MLKFSKNDNSNKHLFCYNKFTINNNSLLRKKNKDKENDQRISLSAEENAHQGRDGNFGNDPIF